MNNSMQKVFFFITCLILFPVLLHAEKPLSLEEQIADAYYLGSYGGVGLKNQKVNIIFGNSNSTSRDEFQATEWAKLTAQYDGMSKYNQNKLGYDFLQSLKGKKKAAAGGADFSAKDFADFLKSNFKPFTKEEEQRLVDMEAAHPTFRSQSFR